MSSMCTPSGQLYVAHRSVVDEVSLATFNELRIFRVGDGECLMSHIVATHGEGAVVLDPRNKLYQDIPNL